MDDSPQLMAIMRANPGIRLSDDDQKRAIAGTLVQVGVGSVLQSGVIAPPGVGNTFQQRGCISWLKFQNSSEDLDYLVVDGNSYSGGNLNEFRDVLLEAGLAMKCVSFCWDREKRQMTMLNVHPLCCCKCESTGNG